jgi:5'-nucleotidase
MSDGLSFDEIITVGFLNDRVEQRLEEYKSRFDVVILGDPDLSFVRDLLNEIQ